MKKKKAFFFAKKSKFIKKKIALFAEKIVYLKNALFLKVL